MNDSSYKDNNPGTVSRRGAVSGAAAALVGGLAVGAGGATAVAAAASAATPAVTGSGIDPGRPPYTRMTPSDTVFLFVDYQQSILAGTTSRPNDVTTRNAVRLLALAEIYQAPVIFSTSEEDEEGDLTLEALQGIVPQAYANRIKRTGTADAFDDPAFAKAVQDTGRQNVILGGLSVETCVSMASMSALRLGYRLKVIGDACAAKTPFGETSEYARLLKYGVDLSSMDQLIGEIVVDYSAPRTQEYYARVRTLLPG